MIKIGKNISKFSKYSCRPTSKSELQDIIKSRTKKEGNNCNLNDIDTIKITNMNYVFFSFRDNYNLENIDISKWNTSKVIDMSYMFADSNFNQDISNWKINKDCNTPGMFADCPIKEEFKPKSLQK